MNDKKIVVKIITFLLLFTVSISLCFCGVTNTNGINYIKKTLINMNEWSSCTIGGQTVKYDCFKVYEYRKNQIYDTE